MGWWTTLIKKDGTTKVLRSNSQWVLKQIRSKECKDLVGQLVYVSPIKREGDHFNFPILVKAKKVDS